MFTVSRLYNALSDALTDEEVAQTITDEASVMEWSGYQPLLVQGDARNIKVTYPQDFELAGFYLFK
jgi:2-C-methyl-D-erythritol 4-phosphate cytidylyltransferase